MAADPLTAATADNLLNYDTTDDEDIFGDKPSKATRDDKPNLSPRHTKRKADDGEDGLGIDEEVQIKKKRKPIAKLDEARLLSALGIPKLRELVRSGKMSKKLRLKGKGHEFSDVARLLNYYQQWLDNLYPRAKFADGLQIIEKVGHSKRMQVMRKEWIDEGKPGYIKKKSAPDRDEFEDDDLFGSGEVNTTENRTDQRSEAAPNTSRDLDVADDSLFIAESNTKRNSGADDDLPEDDELEALLAEQETRPAPPKAQATITVDSEGEDDLDALLAEQDTRRAPAPTSSRAGDQRSGPTPRMPHQFDDDEDEDEDDLDALLAEQETETRSRPSTTQIQSPPARPAAPKRPSRIFEDEDDDDDDDAMDDLDALLAEQDVRQTQQSNSRPSAGTPMAMRQVIERDNNHDEGSEADIEAQMDIPAGDDAHDLELDLPPTQGAGVGVGKTKEASQDADGEDFDAEGMFSSSPARQDE